MTVMTSTMVLNSTIMERLKAQEQRAKPALREFARKLAAVDEYGRCPLVFPIVLDASDRELLIHADTVFGDILEDLPKLLFGDLDSAMKALGAPPELTAFLAADIPLSVRIVRSDFLRGPEGWMLCECNILANVGGLLVKNYDRMVRDHEFLNELMSEYGLHNISPVDALAETLWTRVATLPLSGRPYIAIIDWEGCDAAAEAEQREIAECYRSHGFDAVVCHQRQVRYERGRLWADRRPVDVVHREFMLEDILKDPVSAMPVLEAAMSGSVVLVSTCRDEWLGSKAQFALLHEARARNLLDAPIAELVRRVVPPTWFLDESGTTGWEHQAALPSELRASHSADLVLKPVIGCQGIGVELSASMDPELFWSAVEAAMDSRVPHVIQEFVRPDPVPFVWLENDEIIFAPGQPHPGVFRVDDRYAGMEGRMLQGTAPGKHNLSNGTCCGGVWSPEASQP